MNICQGCNCQAPTLYTMPDNKRLCDYCSDSWVIEANVKPVHKPREYNNVKFVLRTTHGTIKSWAKFHNFNPGVVNQVLNRTGYYAVTDMDEMSATHLDILIALESEGLGKLLISDGYIDI